MEMDCVSCKKNTAHKKFKVLEKLNRIDSCFYKILLFVARKNRLLLKIKNSIILIFNMISL